MIEANTGKPFDALASRLTRRAEAIARREAVQIALARRGDPNRWRDARLLWPEFTQG